VAPAFRVNAAQRVANMQGITDHSGNRNRVSREQLSQGLEVVCHVAVSFAFLGKAYRIEGESTSHPNGMNLSCPNEMSVLKVP